MELEGFANVGEVLKSGVYALVYRGAVVYIGKSKVMLTRIYTHRSMYARSRKPLGSLPWLSKGIKFDDVWVRPCPSAKLDQLEYEMINRYKPKHNQLLKNGLPVPLTPDIQNLIASMLGTAVNVPTPAQNHGSIRRRV
jgi:GIY-YIG catalytic domain